MKLTKYVLIILALVFFVQKSKAQSSFTHSVSGLSVSFTSTSTATSTATYIWSFGDGNFSTLQNPNHAYTSPGNYSVFLRVTDSFWIDTAFAIIHISSCPWHASFTQSSSGLTYNFVNTSTGITPTTHYNYQFGDGSISNSASPTHTYASAGTYNIIFMIWDTVGGWCMDTTYSTIIAPSSVCTIAASFTDTSSGLTTTFTSTSTGTSPTSTYLWRFGDGNISTLQNPIHTYATSGTYYIDFMVSDTAGGMNCSDTLIDTIMIIGTTPSCPINASFTETVTGNTVTFNSTSTGLSGPASYSWDFANGGTLLGSSTGSITSFTFPSQGIYTVYLIVSDSTCSDSTFRRIVVSTTIFTPNGDGIDDVVILPCSGANANIYNSSGTLVKTLVSITTSWNGANNLGGLEPTGLYFIVCSGFSTPIPVTLIR